MTSGTFGDPSVALSGLGILVRRDPGAARSAPAPGYLLPRLRRWLIGTFLRLIGGDVLSPFQGPGILVRSDLHVVSFPRWVIASDFAMLYRKYRVISEPIHFPTGTETPFPIIR
jgi:hypothetical protein